MAGRLTYVADGQREEAGSFLHWRELLAVVVERGWIGITVALAVFLYIWFDTHRQTPYYRSTATLMVEAHVPQMFSFQELMSFNARNLEYFNTHVKALHSRPMVAQAIEAAGLSEHRAFTPGVPPGPEQVEAALRFISIAPVERTRMLDIVVEHPDPGIAAALANGLAGAYIQIDLDNRMGTSIQAVEWLRARAEEYRANLEAGLVKLQQYREATQSVSLEEDQDIVIAKLKALNTALTAAQTERIQRETRWSAVEAQLAAHIPPTEIVLLLDEPLVVEAQRRWLDQRRNVDQLRQRYRAEHPDYLAALEVKRTYRTQFEEAAQRAVDRLQNRYRMAVTEEQNLRLALQEQEKEAFELDRKLVEYNDLRRNVQAEEEVYQAIISRMKEASLAGTLPTEMIRLVEEARPARAPFRPNRPRAMLRGAGLGAVLGLLAIFGLYMVDHRFRHTEEVERKLGLRVLGTVPMVRNKEYAERGMIAHVDETSEAAEAFRFLRASLLLENSNSRHKSLMVTSSHPGEGKSLVASNLAISLAQDGHRTLLVGADLRRPSLHKLFQVKSAAGLSEILQESANWREAVVRECVPGLDVLMAGKIPSRPSELLGGGRWRNVLNEIKDHYDQIIIDAPPMLGVSDALVLLAQTEAVLFVLRYGVTHVMSARHALSKIEASGTPCAGAIMNGVNIRSMANYCYYKRYGYGRYHYYRASESTDADARRAAQ